MGKNNPHDTFAREFLSYKQNAVDFFKGILPEKIARNLDLQTLAEDKNNYTDEKLHQYFSDVVYTCRYTGGIIKLCLLFEHKSFPPRFPHSQLLRYISNIWQHHAKQGNPIPVMLPILFYHGKMKWMSRPLHYYLSGDTALFTRFIPQV